MPAIKSLTSFNFVIITIFPPKPISFPSRKWAGVLPIFSFRNANEGIKSFGQIETDKQDNAAEQRDRFVSHGAFPLYPLLNCFYPVRELVGDPTHKWVSLANGRSIRNRKPPFDIRLLTTHLRLLLECVKSRT